MPNVMQTPPVVRIVGVDSGTPLAIALAQRYAGMIQHFVRSQRQNQEIAGLNHVRVSRRFEDVDMTYDRLFGREVLTIEVRPSIVRETERRVLDESDVEMLLDVLVYLRVRIENLE